MKILHKLHIGDKTTTEIEEKDFEEERTNFTRDGKKVPGFASAVVPTLEEKMVAENLRTEGSAEGETGANGSAKDVGSDQVRSSDGDLYGAPADASKSAKADDQPPHARTTVDDATDDERMAPRARSTIRKQLASKLGSKNWSVAVKRPNVEASAFEDPVADSFWKDVWVACAVYNVCFCSCIELSYLLTSIRRKFIGKYSMQSRMTWSQPGNNTKNL